MEGAGALSEGFVDLRGGEAIVGGKWLANGGEATGDPRVLFLMLDGGVDNGEAAGSDMLDGAIFGKVGYAAGGFLLPGGDSTGGATDGATLGMVGCIAGGFLGNIFGGDPTGAGASGILVGIPLSGGFP